jgi:hypothetical protein
MVCVNPMPRGEHACLPSVTKSYEGLAMQVVIEHEQGQGRQVCDVHEHNPGYNLTSMELHSGELRLIEVKGLWRRTGLSC